MSEMVLNLTAQETNDVLTAQDGGIALLRGKGLSLITHQVTSVNMTALGAEIKYVPKMLPQTYQLDTTGPQSEAVN